MDSKEIEAQVAPHTDSSGDRLIQTYLKRRRPVALVFTEAEELAARSIGFETVYVHV